MASGIKSLRKAFAEEQADSVQVHGNSIRFWRELSGRERRALAKVTEDMPVAIRDLAGIMCPYDAMMRRSVGLKVFMTLFLMLRLVVNTGMIAAPVYHYMVDGHYLEFNYTHSNAVIDGDTLTACYEESVLLNATSQLSCTVFHHTPEWFGLIIVLEALVVVPASLATLGCSLRFLCLSDQPRDGLDRWEATPPRAMFLEERPFLFVLLPRLASGWSMLACLILVNTSFTLQLLTRGDLELYLFVFLQSLFPRLAGAWWRYIGWRRKEGIARVCCRILDAFLVVGLIFLGVVALHLKFLRLYFAASVRFEDWDWYSWFVFLGFANQVIGLFDFDLTELSRCLLMKFGGSDSVWSVEEMQCVPQYFGLIFRRFVEGRLQGKDFSGLRALGALVTFTSDSLQQLLLSKSRAQAQQAARDVRMALLEILLNEKLLEGDRDCRIAELGAYQVQLATTCGLEMRCSPSSNLTFEEDLLQAERIRAVAQLESHIAHLQEECDDQSSETGSDDAVGGTSTERTSISLLCGLVADDNASSVDVHDSSIRFWRELHDSEKGTLAKVTEDVPIAVRDLAGIMRPYKGIMLKSAGLKVSMTLFLMLRFLINTYVVGAPVYHWADRHFLEFNYSHSRAVIDGDTLTVCYEEAVLYNATGQPVCTTFHHAPEWYGLIVILEALVVIPASLATLGFSLRFLCLSDQPRAGRDRCEATPPRASFIEERPFLFVLLPKLASGWSMMACLILVNTSFTAQLLTRGDLELYAFLFLQSLCPRLAGALWRYVGWRRKEGIAQICSRVLDAFLVAGLIFLGALAMVIKLFRLYFVTSVRFEDWDWRSWGVFLGFVNQLVGIFDIDFAELSRCLLMKFGGADSVWSVEEMQCVPQYFGLVFRRFVEGRLQGTDFSGLRALGALVTFTSDNLQQLLLSKSRARALRAAHDGRLALLEVLLDERHLARAPSDRIWWLEKYQESLAADCGLKIRRGKRPGSDLPKEEHLLQAERIRAVAQIQSHIAHLQEGSGHDSSDSGSDTTETATEDDFGESEVESPSF